MLQTARFLETPNGPIVVVDVPRQMLRDEVAATRLRHRLSRALGELPVLLRCKTESSVAFNSDPNLQRYAVDPMMDGQPVVRIDLEPSLREAA
jgi:hypothetical protein